MRSCAAGLLCVVLAVVAGVAWSADSCNATLFVESLNITTTKVSCFGGSDGSVHIEYNESLGCTPRLFSLMRSQQKSNTTGDFYGLEAGEYELTIKFNNSNTNGKGTVTIGSVDVISFNATINDLNGGVCDACLAEAEIRLSGGVAPYTFNGTETNSVCSFFLFFFSVLLSLTSFCVCV